VGHAALARRRGALAVAAAALERAAALTPEPVRKGERLVRAAEVAYELGWPRPRGAFFKLQIAELLRPRTVTLEMIPRFILLIRWGGQPAERVLMPDAAKARVNLTGLE